MIDLKASTSYVVLYMIFVISVFDIIILKYLFFIYIYILKYNPKCVKIIITQVLNNHKQQNPN